MSSEQITTQCVLLSIEGTELHSVFCWIAKARVHVRVVLCVL